MFQSEESWDIKQSKTHYKAKYLELFAKQKYIIRLMIVKTDGTLIAVYFVKLMGTDFHYFNLNLHSLHGSFVASHYLKNAYIK